nr:Maf family nucleotide pyrophosphatase [Solitalea koreensis]
MGYEFEVVLKEVDESYPVSLNPEEVALYIAEKKADAYEHSIHGEIVITADTLVCVDGKILGKPTDKAEAIAMIRTLSGRSHQVITGVAILHAHELISFADTTLVYFAELSDEEIEFYIDTYQPYDKAGAYGIQEWIGVNKIERIEGSYTNVMGLPTEKLYRYLQLIH